MTDEVVMHRVAMGGRLVTGETHSDECLKVVDAWLREYVAVAEERVGRSGPVCPFMPRALDQHAVEARIRYDIKGSSEPELINELGAEISEFGKTGRSPHKSGVLLDSRLIVMPQLGPAGWGRLDAAYEYLKDFAVESGLMVGQFHPRCDERAVRNSDFRVSVAPVAMLAIRHMAPHDILFLNRSERWFKEYDSYFRSHFERGRIRDPLLLSLYSGAHDRFETAGWQAEPSGRSSTDDDSAAGQSSSR
jgi:heptaprenyl diphosphate synthase